MPLVYEAHDASLCFIIWRQLLLFKFVVVVVVGGENVWRRR